MHLGAIENIFFLILIAIIGLIRWAYATAEDARNKQAQKRAQPQSPNAPVQRAPAQTEEERVRRFMEALGVPTTNAPPPKTPPRRVTPRMGRELKRRVPPIDPFPLPRPSVWVPEAAEEPPVVSTPPPLPESFPPATTTVVATTPESPPVFEVHVVDGRALEPVASAAPALVRQSAVVTAQNWAARLREAGGLRDAIVLREVFGPPRSLQPADVHSLG